MSLLPNIWLVFPNHNKARKLLETLFNQKTIGGKHTPEQRALKHITKWLNKKEKKEFRKEYVELIRKRLILREKKRTKKGTDWHIRLNPEELKEIYRILEETQ